MKSLLILTTLFALSTSWVFAAEAPKNFQRMDANSDGQIDAQEWLAKGKKDAERSGKAFDEAKLLKRMAAMDANGDKALSVKEFGAASSGKKDPAKEKKEKKEKK